MQYNEILKDLTLTKKNIMKDDDEKININNIKMN
jgi:hypothetical protein